MTISNLIQKAKDTASKVLFKLAKNKKRDKKVKNAKQKISTTTIDITDIYTDISGVKYTKHSILESITLKQNLNINANDLQLEITDSLTDYENGIVTKDTSIEDYTRGILSVDDLAELFPNARRNYISACLEALDLYSDIVGLSDKGKLMALGQMAAETEGFIYIAEIGKGRGKKYGKPAGPYNKIYYGRGPIQVTWEKNYKTITQIIFPKMGINADIWADPDLCEKDIKIGCAASMAWFMLPGNGIRAIQCANNGDVDGLSKAINGGNNARHKRRDYTHKIFEKAKSK